MQVKPHQLFLAYIFYSKCKQNHTNYFLLIFSIVNASKTTPIFSCCRPILSRPFLCRPATTWHISILLFTAVDLIRTFNQKHQKFNKPMIFFLKLMAWSLKGYIVDFLWPKSYSAPQILFLIKFDFQLLHFWLQNWRFFRDAYSSYI